MSGAFYVYRRDLPHWRANGAVYFTTWRLAGHQRLDDAERDTVMSALQHFAGLRFRLGPHVVMDDHVHTLVWPLPGHPLTSITQSWTGYSGRVIQQRRAAVGPLWQRETFDRIVRDDDELREKAGYILANPFRRWPDLTSYRWVSAGDGFQAD